jgi:hypothetical protein|tara:strand:+ start:403 stop:627 length:225 start_codon:yes stop_codon:yes gene_type:complete
MGRGVSWSQKFCNSLFKDGIRFAGEENIFYTSDYSFRIKQVAGNYLWIGDKSNRKIFGGNVMYLYGVFGLLVRR